ncbi:MAG: hypothetical protein ACREJC_21130 [Tepidisphaeraceae bacterium]
MSLPVGQERRRFYAMQASMWALLACTVGLAALVDVDKRSAMNTVLGSPAGLETVSFAIPRGWQVVQRADEDGLVAIIAVEQLDVQRARQLTLSERSPRTSTWLDQFTGGSRRASRRAGASDSDVQFGNVPGTLRVTTIPLGERGGKVVECRRAIATAELPSGAIVSISLDSFDGNRRFNADNDELVRKVAGSMKPLASDSIGPSSK